MSTGRPRITVAVHANTWTPLGIVIRRLAAAKKIIVTLGRPVANMWCTQTPNPMKPVATVASATHEYATIGRCANVGMIEATIPTAGRKMM